MSYQRMTDEQTWAIINAPPTIGHAELSRRLGVTYNAVFHRRNHAWVCNVRYAVCIHCDQPITLKDREGRNGPPQHQDCRLKARRLRRLERLRNRPPEDKARRRAITDQAMQPIWAETERRADRVDVKWTNDEDHFLLESMDRSIREVALKLGRTYHAVANRRSWLRK